MLETLAVVVLSAGAETGLWSSVEMVEENKMNDGIPTILKLALCALDAPAVVKGPLLAET